MAKIRPGSDIASIGEIDGVDITIDTKMRFPAQTHVQVLTAFKAPHATFRTETRFDFMTRRLERPVAVDAHEGVHGEYWTLLEQLIIDHLDIKAFIKDVYSHRVKDKKEALQTCKRALENAERYYAEAMRDHQALKDENKLLAEAN